MLQNVLNFLSFLIKIKVKEAESGNHLMPGTWHREQTITGRSAGCAGNTESHQLRIQSILEAVGGCGGWGRPPTFAAAGNRRDNVQNGLKLT